MLKKWIILCFIFFLWIGVTNAADIYLGAPPTAPSDLSGLLLSPQEKAEAKLLQEFQAVSPVNPQNREMSRIFYYDVFLASGSQDIGWTGNRSTCQAGDPALNFRDAVALRINYFRAMAGVPAQIVFSDAYSGKNQKTALMMSVNDQLSHNPPADWTCYTLEGAEGAQNSNLALGYYGWDSISLGYIKDPGVNNGAAGHRRWILYPQTQQMGTGDLPNPGVSANALWVFDSNIWNPRPVTREAYVAWPPPGYIPYQVVYPRWSFAYDEADFSQATVTMTESQQPISTALETFHSGYGENTLVWRPKDMGSWSTWLKPTSDTRYRVTINNVLIEGSPRSFSYEVTVFDPAIIPPAIIGDLNTDGNVDLADAILSLKIAVGIDPGQPICVLADVNNDDKIGIEEAIYIIEKVAGMRK